MLSCTISRLVDGWNPSAKTRERFAGIGRGALMKRWAKRVIVPLSVVLAACAVFMVVYLFRSKEVPALHATGIIDGIEVNLSPKVAGRISRVRCQEGETVKEGQAVITLESDDVKASVEQAIAGVERARADIRVAEASIGSGKATVLGAEAEMKSAAADVEKAHVQMEQSKREAERRKDLYEKNLIARESFDQMVAVYDGSVAAYDSSKEKLNAARSKKDAAVGQWNAAVSQMNSSRARLKEAEANVGFYRSKLNDMIITTPVNGTVIFKAFEKGETVGPGVTILTVVDLNSLYARIDVDETNIGDIVLNGPAVVTVEGVAGGVFKGRISEIGRYAGFATQRDVVRGREDIKTFRVKVRVVDPSGILKPGMTVDVGIPKPPTPSG